MIKGLFETHVLVTNLEVSSQFYEKLGLRLAHQDNDRRIHFFWIGNPGQAMLGLWEVPLTEMKTRHFAFEVNLQDIRNCLTYLQTNEMEVRNHSRDGLNDLEVIAWMPAVNIYFRDPDGNSLEFISMLPDPPKPELGTVKFDTWEKIHNR